MFRFLEKKLRQKAIERRLKKHEDWVFPSKMSPPDSSSNDAKKKPAEKEPAAPESALEERYRRHPLPSLKFKTRVLQAEATPPPEKEKKPSRFTGRQKTYFLMIAATLFTVAAYFYWASAAVFILKIIFKGDCGYWHGLFEPYKECRCERQMGKLEWLGKRTLFCPGECSDCRCWRLEVEDQKEGKSLKKVPVSCD